MEKNMYCINCGTQLITKTDGIDGQVPYCPHCHKFQYPPFNSAISTVILSPDLKKVLLIKQYGRKDNILVAGYVTKGENLETTLKREIKEEVNLEIKNYLYNDNQYYAPSNTLITNFIVISKNTNIRLTNEVDDAQWYPIDEALKVIKPQSLASYFLNKAVNKIKNIR